MSEAVHVFTVMLSLRIPSRLAKRLDAVAEATGRTRTYVAAKAIEAYVESEEATLAKIREGLAAIDAGAAVSHEQALAFVAQLKTQRQRRKA